MLYMQPAFSPRPKVQLTPREYLGAAAAISPTTDSNAATTGSLAAKLNAMIPTHALEAADDDAQTLLSFGAATRMFSKNQTIVCPIDFDNRTNKTSGSSATISKLVCQENNNLVEERAEKVRKCDVSHACKVTSNDTSTTPTMIPFRNSKVFLSRYNAAATLIQKIARARAGRNQTTVRRITVEQERARAKQNALQEAAAISLQALVRGWASRRNQRVQLLHVQLERIEHLRQRDLQAIEMWKEQQMQLLREQVKAHMVKTEERFRQNDERINAAKQIIQMIKRENQLLREKNKEIETAMEQLREENDVLEQENADMCCKGQKLAERMAKVNSDNAMMFEALRQMHVYQVNLKETIESSDDHITYEQNVSRCRRNTIRQLVIAIKDTSDDLKLVEQVELYLERSP